MTYEVGLRFLTDYLQQDKYFKIAYPEHNLVRCRTQFQLLLCLEHESAFAEDTVRSLLEQK